MYINNCIHGILKVQGANTAMLPTAETAAMNNVVKRENRHLFHRRKLFSI